MLKHILIETRLFGDEARRGKSQKGLLGFLESLTWWNQIWLEDHPETPLLYQSGVKYLLPEQFNQASLPEVERLREHLKNAPAGLREDFEEIADQVGAGEHFRDFAALLENGGGDCDNVSCARAAEIRVRLGVQASPFITWRRRPDGGMTYHALVRWPDGSSEDPSILLGMGGEAKSRERAIERAKNEYRRWQCGLASRQEAYTRAALALPVDMRGELDQWFDDPRVFVAKQHPEDLAAARAGGATVIGQQNPAGFGFGQGVQFLPNFWTDDAFEDWRPGAAQFMWADPRYAGGNIPGSPTQIPSYWIADRDDEGGSGRGWRGDTEGDDVDDFDFVDGLPEIDDDGQLVEPAHKSYALWSSARAGRDWW